MVESKLRVVDDNRLEEVNEKSVKAIHHKSIIQFGEYYQEQDKSYGKQPIEWIPLEWRADGTVLVVSSEILDCKEFDTDGKGYRQTWEECSLRKWLNNEFISEAFSTEEQKLIKEIRVVNKDNREFCTKGGNDTLDRVFLLSMDEFQRYCIINDFYCNNACRPTKYAKSQGARVSGSYGCEWWLRTLGYEKYGAPPSAVLVWPDGKLYKRGAFMEISKGIRPAMILDATKF